MTGNRRGWRLSGALAVALLLVVLLAGCAGAINAESASSLVRARPTTPPQTYTLQFGGTVAALSEALDKLAALLTNPHYFDDSWKSEAVNLSTLVELSFRQLDGLSAPEPDQAQHAAVVQAIQDCQTLTVYVFQGINNLDKGPFDEVQQRVEFCRNKLRLATQAPGSVEQQSQPASIEAARQEVQVTVKREANLRAGPSTKYPVVGAAQVGDKFTVTGRTAKGDWLQISGEKARSAWIAAFLVQAAGDLQVAPVVAVPTEPAPAPATAVATPAAAP